MQDSLQNPSTYVNTRQSFLIEMVNTSLARVTSMHIVRKPKGTYSSSSSWHSSSGTSTPRLLSEVSMPTWG